MQHSAFQGGPGATSHGAAPRSGGERITAVPRATSAAVFDAVARRAADAAMAPVGNSFAVPVQEVCLLNDPNMGAAGTCQRLVRHCVMASPGSALGHNTQVLPHPHASQRCDACPERLHVETTIGAFDTAGSAKRIREQELYGGAAIVSPRRACLYQLATLASAIQARTDHATSFVPLCASASGHQAWALLGQLEAARVSGHHDQAEALQQGGQQRCRWEDPGIRDARSLAAGGPASTDCHCGGSAARGRLTTRPRSGCNPVARSQEVRV
jgi:prephenate dehydratase